MSSRNLSFFVIVIVILIVLIFFAPSFGWTLRAWLGPNLAPSENASSSLAAQNEALEAELAEFQSIAAQIPNASSSVPAQAGIRTVVYSRYPLNFKDQILVGAGTNEGVALGKAVLFQGIVIGTVAQAFSDTSLVATVFDPSFRMPVRVGSAGVDALLQGGAYPELVSIAKDATVAPGDIIFAAAPGIPYGLPIGTVGAVSVAPNDLFDQATVDFAYDINDVESVLIEK